MTAPKLMEIRLPAGDAPGFQIDYDLNTGARKLWSSDWIGKGFDGVRFIGAGRDLTHIRPGASWDTIAVERHAGIVQLESLTVHVSRTSGVHFGISRREKPLIPSFKLIGRDVMIEADDPPEHRGSGMWGLFTYLADIDMAHCLWRCKHLTEHASYHHGFASTGLRWDENEVESSGAECLKVRPDPSETFPTPKALIVVQRSKFKDWYAPWSSRGGGGMVMQGTGLPIWIKGCEFWAPLQDASHTRCVMVDDNGGKFWGAGTGALSKGFANGPILIEDSAFRAGIGTENLTPCIRVGPDGGTQQTARSVTIRRSAIYGKNTQLQFSNIPAGKLLVEGCNTPQLRDLAHNRGIDTEFQTGIPTHDRVIPVSEGFSA